MTKQADKPQPWKPVWRKTQDVIPKGTILERDGKKVRLRRDLPYVAVALGAGMFVVCCPVWAGTAYAGKELSLRDCLRDVARHGADGCCHLARYYLAPVEEP